MKKAYILCLVSKFCETIVDYDTETLDKVSFLFKLEDYMCLVTVKIGMYLHA